MNLPPTSTANRVRNVQVYNQGGRRGTRKRTFPHGMWFSKLVEKASDKIKTIKDAREFMVALNKRQANFLRVIDENPNGANLKQCLWNSLDTESRVNASQEGYDRSNRTFKHLCEFAEKC